MKDIFLIAALLGIFGIVGINAQEALNDRVKDSLMNLGFEEFDQDMEGGWRLYANRLDFRSATTLIKLYLEKHPEMEPNQKGVMNFHCGQLLALMGEDEEAVPYMKASKKEGDDPMLWNVYVDATTAFLQKDRDMFLLKKTELKDRSMMPKDSNRNLQVLELLDRGFYKSYKEALNPDQ